MSVKYNLPSTFANTEAPTTYDSPYSQHPVDNALQGALTNGVLVNVFKAPKTEEQKSESAPMNYVYDNRVRQNKDNMNQRVAVVKDYVKESVNNDTKDSSEHFNGLPGFVDSHLVQGDITESFTSEQSLNIIVVVLAVIAISVCGVIFGFIVPANLRKNKVHLVGDDNVF